MTKKGRTLMTAFAGSIGIIGIASILALANGVNNYIKSVEEETLSEYPLQIQSTGFDMTSMMFGAAGEGAEAAGDNGAEDQGEDSVHVVEMVSSMVSSIGSNDLASLKKYLDSGESNIDQYTNAIEYTYNVAPQIFSSNTEKLRQVNPDTSFSALGLGSSTSSNSLMSMSMSTDTFYEMPSDPNLYQNQYDVKAGRWPQSHNEVVLVLTGNGGISDFMLYTLGLRDSAELDDMVKKFAAEEEVTAPTDMEDPLVRRYPGRLVQAGQRRRLLRPRRRVQRVERQDRRYRLHAQSGRARRGRACGGRGCSHAKTPPRPC